MILCVNPNAAIDKTVVVESFRLNEGHRPEQVIARAGGKGCNCARGLRRLGETPVVTGWVGGFAGQFIEAGLHGEGIQTDFVHTALESRTCLAIVDRQSNTVTEINEKGDAIPTDKVEELKAWFGANVARYAAVTLSGSLPPGVPAVFYAQLIDLAHAAGVLILLDTSGEALKRGLAARPFLAKPNRKEFAELIGREPATRDEFVQAAAEVAVRYGTWITLSLGADGAVATDGKEVLHAWPPQVVIKSAVGSGDCMLAGITYGLTHSLSFEQALVYGVAAGTANALSLGAGSFTLGEFDDVRARVTLERAQHVSASG